MFLTCHKRETGQVRRGACSFLGVSAPGAHGLPFSTQYDVEIYTSVWCVIGYACAHVCVMCVCVRVCACVTTTAALISADLTQTTQESVKSSLIRATSSFPWHLGGGVGDEAALSPPSKKKMWTCPLCAIPALFCGATLVSKFLSEL